MKKMLAVFLTFCICVCICACNSGNSKSMVADYEEGDTILTSSNNTILEENSSVVTEDTVSKDANESIKTEAGKKTSSKSNVSSKTEVNKNNSSSNGNKVSSSQQKASQVKSTKAESSVKSSSQNSSSKVQENKSILTGISVVYVGKKLKVGDILKNSDFEVVAKYSDKEQIKVTDFTIDVTKLQKVGNNTVTITYENKSHSITLNVLEGNAPNANPGGEFGYEIYNGEITITAYVGAKTDVVVPSWIDDMPVTCIEWLSEKVTSVVLPNSITRIQRKAFDSCDDLVSVTIGPNIVEMGDNIFYHCDKLKNVTIKTGATLIGNGMFSACSSIESIILPKTITTIQSSAFSSCENLKSIYIPASVTSIAEYGVFSFCNNLQNITVEQGSYAQRWCLNNGYGEKLKYN